MLSIALTAALATASPQTETCSRAVQMAESVMETRQSGMSAVSALDYYSREGDPKDLRLYTDMLVAAYARFEFDSPEYQRKAVTDFGNEVWVECMTTWPDGPSAAAPDQPGPTHHESAEPGPDRQKPRP